ncbi:hypothetical protein [Undibacterium sp. TJN19]|uniref:hypothetical protein n=1 Tax=Undibacterium sp. TJN19 TaxID=3413055 RepID=UPI003BF10B25
MKPRWQPIPLPGDIAPYGDSALQPYLDKGNAVVFAGGPSGLSLVKVNANPTLMTSIPAQSRITGFAVHSGELFLQDGPVLSRWELINGTCMAAINLLNPKLSWKPADGPVNWGKLHVLDTAQSEKKLALVRARRKAEWLTLLENCEALQHDTSATRTPDIQTKLLAMIADLGQLVGANRGQIRAQLATAEDAAAQMIFSAPVVRTHQVAAKAGALVYAIGRDGTIHPLDDKLQRMGTVRHDNSARPALAMIESETEAHSDEFACQLFYVTGEGLVREIEGHSLPPAVKGKWPARGRSSLQPGIRPRIDSGLLWGNDAQETGVFALPIDEQGSASRIKLAQGEDWRWLELPKEGQLALVCTDTSSRLISFAKNNVTAERWGARKDLAPHYSSFLETKNRPLMVAEFDREPRQPGSGLGFRVLVANNVDAADQRAVAWYPPPPESIRNGTLEAFSPTAKPPVSIRTQVTISMIDAYMIARDSSTREQLLALLADGEASWSVHKEKILQPYADAAAAGAALGELPLPPMIGKHALYSYQVGAAVTSEDAENARKVLQRMRDLASPIIVRIIYSSSQEAWGGTEVNHSSHPLANERVELQFSDGDRISATTDANGDVALPFSRLGSTVTSASASSRAVDSRARSLPTVLKGRTGNEIVIHYVKPLDTGGGRFPRKPA